MPIFPIDLAVNQYAESIHSGLLDFIMEVISSPGAIPIICILTLILGFYLAGKRKQIIALLISALGEVAIAISLQQIIDRTRPNPSFTANSFPSAHVMFYIGFFGYLYFTTTNKFIKSFCVLMIILVGVSRIYLGYHWLTDVLAGYVLGLIWLLVVRKLYNDKR